MKKLNGVLLVDKPSGISSFGVIQKIKESLSKTHSVRFKDLPKLGHGGTLDPFATGLLVIGIGDGVKLLRYFLHSDKTYSALVKFGEHTESGDFTDPITKRCDSIPDFSLVQKACLSLLNNSYFQTPPMTSAKKIEGKKLYELAREGISVPRQPEVRKIYALDVWPSINNSFKLNTKVQSGTYIRVLAQDIAALLGNYGHLTELRRLQSGSFKIEYALDLDQTLKELQAHGSLPRNFIPFDQMLVGMEQIELHESEVKMVIQGNTVFLNRFYKKLATLYSPRKQTVILVHKGKIIAAIEIINDVFKLDRVFLSQGINN